MAIALLRHEIAQQISAKVGLRPEYIDVYATGNGWDASLLNVPSVWTSAKNADVKQTARAFQSIYTLKKTTD